jgi:hypothetical protein
MRRGRRTDQKQVFLTAARGARRGRKAAEDGPRWNRNTRFHGARGRVAEEAHRRWPEGRSERGASKAKVVPPR